MKILLLNKGFNFSQDGPGNRLVYHLQGCNFHCPWCSNPESIAMGGTMMTTSTSNTSKLSCVEVDTNELISESLRSSMMFFGGGGVTFTGGEPTMQFAQLKELLTLLKQNNIHTAVETNGCHEKLPQLFGLIDFLIMDFKHYDSKKHLDVIGCDNSQTMENIKKALLRRKQLLIRIPLINGFNSSTEDALKFTEFFKELDSSNCSFELLKYHEYGKDKWAQCHMEYTQKHGQVSDNDFAAFKSTFIENGYKLITT